MITFEEMGLCKELHKAVTDIGFTVPMPVQEQIIPILLNSKEDIVGLSQTGSGKTAAYGLPVLNNIDKRINAPQVLVLSPTRELCIQIANDFKLFAKYLPHIRIATIYGGASFETQTRELKQGAHIIVATPGRMFDFINRKKVQLENINTLILDEADEMLNLGFQEELNNILNFVPKSRRTLLFSATMPKEVQKIAKSYMHNAKEILVGSRNSGADSVAHDYYVVKASDRYQALKRIVDFYPSIYGLIFCRTRMETKEVAEKLMKDGYSADALHGDLSQVQREYTMQRFRLKNLQMLVATDVAARGLDVDNLTHVINYNLPDDDDIYLHRSGRTGRAGKKGLSISICNTRETNRIKKLSQTIQKEFSYKPIPSGEEICKKQLFNQINNMENVEVNTEQIGEFLPSVFKKLEWLSKEELITRFVSIEFNRFLDYYKGAVDINVPMNQNNRSREKGHVKNDDRNMQLLKINIGQIENISPPRLIGLINDTTQRRDIRIGRMVINRSITLFEIDKSATEIVLNALKNSSYEGRKIVASIADGFLNNRNDKKDPQKADRKRKKR